MNDRHLLFRPVNGPGCRSSAGGPSATADFIALFKEQSDAEAFLRRKEIERRRKNRHLDRKLERMLAMLCKLQELRRALNPT